MNTVTSRDGTKIAYEKSGSGPPVILVDGALCSRELGPSLGLAPLLSRNFTVYSYDRRGRNQSGNTLPFSPLREIEDLETLIAAAGGTAMVFAMSSGAALAIQAANHGLKISKLALYEPPFATDDSSVTPLPEHLKVVRRLIAEDHRNEAVKYFQLKVVQIPAIIYYILRITPFWKKLKAVAHTLPYDLEILGDGKVPVSQISRIQVPTAVIYGEKSPEFLRNAAVAVSAALPKAEKISLKGQNHNFSAKAVEPSLKSFFS